MESCIVLPYIDLEVKQLFLSRNIIILMFLNIVVFKIGHKRLTIMTYDVILNHKS